MIDTVRPQQQLAGGAKLFEMERVQVHLKCNSLFNPFHNWSANGANLTANKASLIESEMKKELQHLQAT